MTTVETEKRVSELSSNGVQALWPTVSLPHYFSTTVFQNDELTPLVPVLTLFFPGVSERHTCTQSRCCTCHGLVLARIILGTLGYLLHTVGIFLCIDSQLAMLLQPKIGREKEGRERRTLPYIVWRCVHEERYLLC